MKETGYINLRELVGLLGMDRSTWYRRCQLGMGLVPVKKGNMNMYHVDDVNQLIERQRKERRM